MRPRSGVQEIGNSWNRNALNRYHFFIAKCYRRVHGPVSNPEGLAARTATRDRVRPSREALPRYRPEGPGCTTASRVQQRSAQYLRREREVGLKGISSKIGRAH